MQIVAVEPEKPRRRVAPEQMCGYAGNRHITQCLGIGACGNAVDLQAVPEAERHRQRATRAVEAVPFRNAAESRHLGIEPVHGGQRLRGLRYL